jgi:hypothetical protein
MVHGNDTTVVAVLFAIYFFSVGLILFHSLITGRNAIIWPLVAVFFPFIGALFYAIMVTVEDQAGRRVRKTRRLAQRGEELYKFHTFGERLKFEGILTLMNYRDREVEEILCNGNGPDAEALIEKRMKEAVEKKDSIAVETYEYYDHVLDQVYYDGTVPEELEKLWEREGIKKESKEINDEEYEEQYLTNVKYTETPGSKASESCNEPVRPLEIPDPGESPNLGM